MEVINYLLGYKDLKVVQNTEWFNFSLDSVLLARFVSIRKGSKMIMDLGTGNAPIPLILSKRTNGMIYGIEIQKEVYDLAIKSVELSHLSDRIKIVNHDAKLVEQLFETDIFDTITVNPPYFKINESSILNINDYKTIARHEVLITIDDILRIARKLLKNKGNLGIVHRPDRLIEILSKMRDYNIEPKKIRFVYPKEKAECNIILIEGVKNGQQGLKVLSPLFVHNENGNYTKEVKSMFEE